MTQTDVELQQLREVWNQPDRESDARVAALHRAVAGQALRLRLTLAAEIALTVVSLVTLYVVWHRVPSTRTAVIIAATLLHTAVIWAYAVWNRRGQWNPVAVTLRDAVQVRRAHYRRRLAAYRFVLWLAASLELGFRITESGFKGFIAAFVASLLISFINGVLGVFLPDDKDD